jgi:tetratricopeptide (TPR) repeat protein
MRTISYLPQAIILTLSASAVIHAAHAAEPVPMARTVLGEPNPALAEGSQALQAGDYERGVELTLAGLEIAASVRERTAGHANACAGYVAMHQYDLALVHCSRSLELDPDNWRALNNRAAAWLGKGAVRRAIEDIRRGLEINPDARVLHRSLEIALERARRAPQGPLPVDA